MHNTSRAVLVLAAVTLCVATGPLAARAADAGKTAITVKGSDTMVNLSAAWAEAFMKASPGVTVSVTGGGSGTGIAALLNGTTDVCNASREMKPAEKEQATQNGFTAEETVVARDGIAIVVNRANPVKELTLDQLKRIYTGEATSWSEFGGPDERIVVLSRENNSGTYQFFQEHVLKLEDYTTRALLMPATSAIIEAAASDKWDIGYVGLGYAEKATDRVKIVPVKADDAAPAVMPSEETVRSGAYAISRPLYCYTKGKPAGAVGEFIAFCLGEKGQALVREQGYVPLK